MSSLENYKIIQMIAKGGTAVLYKGVQTSLDRTVAIKKLHQHLTDDENFTRRFILEAKAAASLDHENIVHVIDFGKSDGDYQIIMEYVEGISLKELLKNKRRLPCDVALAIAHQICMGLEHAHSKGIVHRDIKPGNILVTDYGRVKITDFGLAKLTQSSIQQTAADSLLGTPLYMSPEQAYGESVDARSDIFSLGTMLYEMLTGDQPFFSESCMGVINNIINCKVQPPSSINEQIPHEVEHIVLKALNKHREARFQSAEEFRREIENEIGIVRLKEAQEQLASMLHDGTKTVILTDTPRKIRKAARRKQRAKASLFVLAFAAAGVLASFHYNLLPGFSVIESQKRGPRNLNPRSFNEGAFLSQPGFANFADLSAPIDTTQFGYETSSDTSHQQPAPAPPDTVSGADSTSSDERDEQSGARKTAQARKPSISPDDRADQAPADPAAVNSNPRPQKHTRKGWLSVSVDPWAEIYIDGRYRADTPPAPQIELQAGFHSLECKNPQYETYKEQLRITAGELSRRRSKLKKLKGKIELYTEAGAEFYLDGKLFGITPIRSPIEVDVGKHVLVIKKNGFYTWHSEIKIEANQTIPLKITLSPHY